MMTSGENKGMEEEFENFMHRVTEVEKIVKNLASDDPEKQRYGQVLADEVLLNNAEKDFTEIGELTVKTNRTVINKYSSDGDTSDPSKMSQEVFMKSMEKDAKERYENRKIRNERAETYKRIGNGAFKEKKYEKAATYYSKAIEERKDSSVLWNSRALSYLNLGLYEKAILDCEWALRLNEANLKALLLTAKCHKKLGNHDKYEEFMRLARERNPNMKKFIDEYQESIEASMETD